jgi:hypothetical protein
MTQGCLGLWSDTIPKKSFRNEGAKTQRHETSHTHKHRDIINISIYVDIPGLLGNKESESSNVHHNRNKTAAKPRELVNKPRKSGLL